MTKTWSDIASLHSAYTKGELLPSAVVEWYLERIERLNPQLNAFITVTAELARETAKRQDKLLVSDPSVLKHQPLFGVPVAHKDLYMTEGVKTTAGAKLLENHIALYSATTVKRYEEAGAIMLGKLNCDAWAHGSSGENSDFGPARNPWNTDYVPGGSSSGSAVAVAADLCLVASGTDTGGSIRCPASFTGTVGLKPTYGRVSRYGVISMASSLDSIGHFTSSVADSIKVLSVTGKNDPLDATTAPGEFSSQPQPTSLKGVRIGLPKEYLATDPEVTSKVSDAITKFKELGAELVEVSLPSTQDALACYYIIQPAEVSSNLGRFDGIRFGHDRTSFSAEAKRRIILGTYTLSAGYYDAYYKTAQKVRTSIINEFTEVFKSVDLLLAPTMPHLPFKIGEKANDPLALYLEDVLTVPVNMAGLPGLALPCGLSQSGLPIGFQLIGPALSEAKLFAIGELYQSVTNWHHARPKL